MGFVTQVVATPGAQVQAGRVLFICQNSDLLEQLNVWKPGSPELGSDIWNRSRMMGQRRPSLEKS